MKCILTFLLLFLISSFNIFSQNENDALAFENTYYSLWDSGWSNSCIISDFNGISGFSNTLFSYRENKEYIRSFKIKEGRSITPYSKEQSPIQWSLIIDLEVFGNGRSKLYMFSKEDQREQCLLVKNGKTYNLISRKVSPAEEWHGAYPLYSKNSKTLLLYNKKTGQCSFRNLGGEKEELLSPVNEKLFIEKDILDFCEIIQNNTRYLAALRTDGDSSQILLYTILSQGESHAFPGKMAGKISLMESFSSMEYVALSQEYLILYSDTRGTLTPCLLNRDFSVPTLKKRLDSLQVIPGADSFIGFFSQGKGGISDQILNIFLQSSESGETAVYQLKK